jgi:glycosyltransferase involved in cell wall biosynthesis
VLIDYRAALRERSGVGEYTHELTRALLAMRTVDEPTAPSVDLTLFSSSWKDRLDVDSSLPGITVSDHRIPVRVLNLAWHRLGWPPIESLSGASFDVAHSLHPLLMPTRRAAQVVTIHDLNFLHHPERTRAEIRRDYPALVRAHARRADRVIVVSRFTAGEVERLLDVEPDRISICSPGAPAWPPREGPLPPDGYVLFFGTLEPRKNIGALLDAYSRLAERRRDMPQLLLAGKATDASGPWLERLDRAPLKGLARHIGYVEPDKRRALYLGARVLVQPSFEEGFGLTVLEAMTLGVPVVAANRGALPEVLGNAGALVDPDDCDAMAHAIARALDDSGFAATAAERGPALARAFTWNNTAQHTRTAYEQAIARRAERRGAA